MICPAKYVKEREIPKKKKSYRSFREKFPEKCENVKKSEDQFGALLFPTGVPNITPIRSEMKALQLFFVFLHGPYGSDIYKYRRKKTSSGVGL